MTTDKTERKTGDEIPEHRKRGIRKAYEQMVAQGGESVGDLICVLVEHGLRPLRERYQRRMR